MFEVKKTNFVAQKLKFNILTTKIKKTGHNFLEVSVNLNLWL